MEFYQYFVDRRIRSFQFLCERCWCRQPVLLIVYLLLNHVANLLDKARLETEGKTQFSLDSDLKYVLSEIITRKSIIDRVAERQLLQSNEFQWLFRQILLSIPNTSLPLTQYHIR
jgi:hypothetical protein